MTLGDGKRKTLMLLDEYSSGGVVTTDADIDAKMNDFFNMAQLDIISVTPVVKKTEITLDLDEAYTDLPEGFKDYFRVWRDGRLQKKYPIIGGQMFTNHDAGTITLEYIAYPTIITPETEDSYVFEVPEPAAAILPFYVAAQQLIVDLVVDYGALWNMYLYHKQLLDSSLPSGGTGKVRQALFSH